MSNVNDELKKIYYDPKHGFISAQNLYKKAKSSGIKIKLAQAQQFVRNQLAQQLTQQNKKPTIYNTINAVGPKSNFQIDNMIYDRFAYHNYKYILCCIDVYSRFAHCVALTNRREETIIDAMRKCFLAMGVPENINMDNEFNTKNINHLMKEENIRVWYSDPYEINKNAIVERFNRTLALLLQRWRIGSG